MARTARLCLLLTLLAAPAARAQTTPAAPAPVPETPTPDILRYLPHPVDQPASLLTPAAPPGPPAPLLDRPYATQDALLDRPELPPVGWYLDVSAAGVLGHVQNQLNTGVPNPARAGVIDQVGLPSAPLDWNVMPRFEVGYRLPSGIGDVALSYRFLATQGSEMVAGTDGPTQLSSHLDLNVADLDYVSTEISLWPKWDMRWRIGLRYADVYFDSRALEGFGLASLGSGVDDTRVSNSYWGIGPHSGLELSRRIGSGGLSFVGRSEFSLLVGRIRQQFREQSTTSGPDGQPLVSLVSAASSQGVPVLEGEVGFSWQPRRFPNSHLFVGYEYEYWFSVGELSNINNLGGTTGTVSDQGFVLRAQIDF
jgi:hypothetical protein